MKNVRNHEDINLITTEARKNRKEHRRKENNTEVMNKPVYLGLSFLEVSKIVMHEFWYDYVKPIYGEKVKLCYMNTDIVYIKTRHLGRYCKICRKKI